MDQQATNASGARAGRTAEPPGPVDVWVMAVRPKTLLLSIVPVLIGSFWAWHEADAFRVIVVALSLTGAMAIQIGTNLWNDALDGQRGADGAGRLGPPRVTALGLLPADTVRRGAIAAFVVATATGIGNIAIGGWPIALLGVFSIAAGFAYSGGPKPISYTPLGELFVLAFFGIGAVAGTYYLHSGTVSASVVLVGMVIGLPAAAVLLVNNHRDRVADRRAGRRSLAIVLGPGRSHLLYGVMLGTAVIGAIAIVAPTCASGVMAFLPAAVLVVILAVGFAKAPVAPVLNRFLARTAGFQALLAASLAIAALICRS